MPGPVAAVSLREETCVVLSLRATPPVTARRRGRLYIGPIALASGTTVDSSTTVPLRVATALRTDLGIAALFVRDGILGLTGGSFWTIKGLQNAQVGVEIVGGWIDDAFDTQRRRGPKTTARTQWGS